MTEKEKRDEGLLYDANYDSELLWKMRECKDITNNMNVGEYTIVIKGVRHDL